MYFFFFFSSRRRHTRWNCDWSSDVCSSDLRGEAEVGGVLVHAGPELGAERLDGEIDRRAGGAAGAAAGGDGGKVREPPARRGVERRPTAEDDAHRREGHARPLRDDEAEAVREPLAADRGERDGAVHRAASGSSTTTQRRAGSRYSAATRRTSAGPTVA